MCGGKLTLHINVKKGKKVRLPIKLNTIVNQLLTQKCYTNIKSYTKNVE